MNAPPLLVSFENLERLLLAAQIDEPPELEKIQELLQKKFPIFSSKILLGVLFGYSPKFIGAIYSNPARYYRTFYIAKGKGNLKRRIDAPVVALKVIQKWAGYHLANNIKFAPSVVGFVPGISTVQAAAKHCGSRWLFTTDIENFFPTTSEDLVASSLRSYGYSMRGSDLFARLACYNGFLAQGSPASPVLSNMCFREADKAIDEYASLHGLTYTRYADDIAISGKGDIPADIAEFVTKIVTGYGWKISAKKTRFFKAPYRLKVYGLVVNGQFPRLTKGYRNRIRALKHLIKNDRIDKDTENVVLGHLSYSNSIDAFVNSD